MNGAERLLGAKALARHGERIALLCEGEALTFSELAERTRSAHAGLARLGVSPGERVLFLMRDTPWFAAAWLGALRAGAVAVALNNKLSDTELAHIAADSAPRLAVVDEAFAGRPLPGVRIALASQLHCAPQPARDAGAVAAGDEAPAFMLYSSGTTGRPKGIVHAHRSLAFLSAAFRTIGLGVGDRVFTTSRFFFAYGLEHGLLAPLASGVTSIVHPEWPDAEAVIELAERHRPSALFSVPTMYRRLLAEPRGRLAPFRKVRRFVSAGERLSPQLVTQWREAVGGELLNLYGMSETFCACMMTPPGTSDGTRTGVPFDGVRVELRDAAGRLAAAQEPAVLWVRHPAQARGYANLADETREQFRDDWFCTRDIFQRDAQGFLVHRGRTDELVKVAGQWVQPGELEETAALEPAVSEAVCVPVHDEDGLERLALFVTARDDARAAVLAVLAACERRLPMHKRPKWVRVVAEFPRTATGKVQRFKLREILERELAARD